MPLALFAGQTKRIMKKIIALVLILCCASQLQLASAQSAELQQLILNLEKLAQLKGILDNMKKGYDIVSRGYERIKDISEGNFNLHQVFLDGLLAVNPELRKYRRVADIIAYQKNILSEYRSAFNGFKSSGQFTAREVEDLSRVYSRLFDRSLQNLDELSMVLTSGKLRMSDDERIEAIDRLYDDMLELLSVLRRFNRKTALLERQRYQQQQNLDALRKLNGQ